MKIDKANKVKVKDTKFGKESKITGLRRSKTQKKKFSCRSEAQKEVKEQNKSEN